MDKEEKVETKKIRTQKERTQERQQEGSDARKTTKSQSIHHTTSPTTHRLPSQYLHLRESSKSSSHAGRTTTDLQVAGRACSESSHNTPLVTATASVRGHEQTDLHNSKLHGLEATCGKEDVTELQKV
jgi:hypothetical protein